MAAVKSLIVEGGAAGGAPSEIEKPIPTLLIGVGGSGKEVLMRLRKRLHDRYLTKDPGFARFAFVDTDVQSFVPQNKRNEAYRAVLPEPAEMVVCPITKDQFDHTFRILAEEVDSDHLSWLKLDLRHVGHKSLEHGAGTHRQFGRLAFFLNSGAIRRTIEDQLRLLLRHASANSTEVDDRRLEVVIVTSLAGGTGSGMFIDMAYMVRDILNRPDYSRLLGKSITLIAYLPEMFRDKPSELPKKRQNAYAALLELEYYGTPRTGDEVFVGRFEGQAGDDRSARFSACWDGVSTTKYDGPGWDTCFLIDDINDLNSITHLPLDEIYQMTSDYLFIDFERHKFAVSKRSTRANLVQFMERRKETWVRRRSSTSEELRGGFGETDVIYATQNGCRYSTFGLAEVYFDIERLYLAAGYRLAFHLVQRRWLGRAGALSDAKLKELAREDLLDPKAASDQAAPPSFRFSVLSQQMFTRNGANAKSIARNRLANPAFADPSAGAVALAAEMDAHDALLRKGNDAQRGAARGSLIENRRLYEGDPSTLGPLRERVKAVAAHRFSRLGVRAVLELLNHYRETLDAEREAARRAASAPVPSQSDILARLKECDLIPGGFRKLAQGIEYPRALAQTAARVDLAYDAAAGEEVEAVYPPVSRFIGAANQPDYAELTRHRTLHERYSKLKGILESIEGLLDGRFKVASLEDEKHETRRFSLSVGWDAAEYDKRINSALVVNNNVGESAAGSGSFDWRKLEAFVLARLRATADGLDDVRDVASLFDAWLEGPLADAKGVDRIVELLAEACTFVIRKTDRAGGLPFKETEGNGNVVDFLSASNELVSKIENMVKASAVYFPTIPKARVADGFNPAYFNLYGQKSAEHPRNKERNNRLVLEKVREITASKGDRDDSGQLAPNALESEVSSIVLAREMTGFPLQFYSRLDDLKKWYDEHRPSTGSNNECHIDYREASDDLPDITNLSTETYTRIRQYIGYVLRGMLIEVIHWKQGVYQVRVPDTQNAGFVDLRLGSRINRAVKTACEQNYISAYLEERWSKWESRATPRDLAILYVSAWRTYKELQPVLNAQSRGIDSSPLRNCFEEIVKDATRLLNRTPEGERWLAAVAPPVLDFDRPSSGQGPSKADEIAAKCLHRINEDVPIYQIVRSRVGEVGDPGPSEPLG